MSKVTTTEDLIDAQPIGFGADGAAVVPVSTANPLPSLAIGDTASGAADAGNPVKIGGVAAPSNGSAPSATTAGNRVNAWFTTRGALQISLGFPNNGASSPGNQSILTYGEGGGLYAVAVQTFGYDGSGLAPIRCGGLTPFRIVTGTSGSIKASAAQAYTVTAYNANAAVRYLHLYNKASAPTLSTDTPTMTIPLLGASVRDINLTNIGATFPLGLAWAFTTDDVAIPTTAGASGDLHATIVYS